MPDTTLTVGLMPYFFQGLGIVVGVTIGVIAGTAVSVLTYLYFIRRSEHQKIRNLIFELEINIRKIDKWLEELTKYRNAVNGDALHTYFGYFDLSRFVYVTADKMFTEGMLYKHLSHEEIGKLQIIYSDFNINAENYINAQIQQNKSKAAVREEWLYLKPDIISQINFHEDKFKKHQITLGDIVKKLSSH